MSDRYNDRDDDRSRRNYGRRSGYENDRAYGQSSQGRYFDDESERYSGESRWRGQAGGGESGGQYYGTGRNLYRGGESQSRLDWGSASSEDDRDYSSERNRGYGSSGRGSGGSGYGGRSGSQYGRGSAGGEYGRGSSGGEYGRGSSGGEYGRTRYGDEYGGSYGGGFESGQGRYRDTSGGYSQRSNYPSDYSSAARYGERGRAENYGERGRGYGDYDRGGYGEENRGQGEERGWWDRASDTIASWFGDEEAERRRRMDEQQRPYRGRGPKGYRRSDERIKEDVNDRLSEGYLDATEIEVNVQAGEVVLTGTVNNRYDKRRAEDIAESVSGVTHVENRIRVRQQTSAYGTSGAYGSQDAGTIGTGTTGASAMGSSTSATGTTETGTTGTGTTGTGATGTGTSSTGATAARGKSASS